MDTSIADRSSGSSFSQSSARIDEALHNSEVILPVLFELAPDAIVIVTRAGQIARVNAQVESLFGYRRDELIGQPIDLLLPPPALQAYAPYFAAPVAVPRGMLPDVYTRRKDGREFPVEIALNTLETCDGPTALCFIRDITERRQAEQAEREQYILFEALRDTTAMLSRTLDFDEVLNRILSNIGWVAPYDAAAVLLVENGAARVARATGQVERGLADWATAARFPLLGTSTLHQMSETGQPLTVPDTHTFPGWVSFPETAWIRSFVGAPIRVQQQAIGFLTLVGATPNAFTPTHAQHLIAFADQAATALENARLFEAERNAREQAEALRAATQALSATLDLLHVFDLILSELEQVVPYDSVSVQQLVDNRLEIIGGRGLPDLHAVLGMRFDISDGHNPNKEVMRTKAPVIVADAPTIYPEFRAGPHAEASIRSWLGVPLLFGDQLIGMIALDKREAGFYIERHAQLAMAFAAQAAIAIENARLFESEREQRALAEALRDTASSLNSTLHLDEVLDGILVNVGRVLPHDTADIMLLNEEQGIVRVARSRGYAERGVEMPILALQLKASEMPILRGMAETGHAAIIPDVLAAPEWVDLPETRWVRSYAGAPIRVRGRTLGFLNLASVTPGFFTPPQAERLQAFADQAAIAIENARLFEAEREQSVIAEALYDVAAALTSTLNFDEVLDRILTNVGRVVPHDAAGIWLVDAASDMVYMARYRDYYDSRREQAALSARQYIASMYNLRHMAETGQPLAIPDTQTYPGWVDMPERSWVRSSAGVPIRAKGQVIGFLTLYGAVTGFFTLIHAERLRAFADQAAVAIENARLFQTAQQRLKEQSALLSASTAISSSLDLETMLTRLAEQIGVAIDVTSVYITNWDPDTSTSVVLADYYGPYASPLERVSDLGSVYHSLDDFGALFAERLISGETFVCHSGDPALPEPRRKHQLKYAGQSTLVTPLVANQKIVGFVELWESRRRRDFTPNEIVLCQGIARHAAVVFENVRLFQAEQLRRQELEAALQASVSLTASLDLPQVFDAILSAVLSLTPASDAHIFLYQDGRTIFGAAMTRQGRLERPVADPRPHGVTSTVAHTGEALVIEDVRRHPLFAHSSYAWNGAIIGLPLKIGVAVVGVMNVAYTQPRHFSESERRVLSLLAAQAAIAIQNARLFEAEHAQRALAEALRDTASVLNSTLDFERVLDRILENISRIVRHDAATLMTVDAQTGITNVARSKGYAERGLQDWIQSLHFPVADVANLRRMAETGQPMIIVDTHAEPSWVRLPESAWGYSYAGAPIRIKGRVIGFLNLESAQPGFFKLADAERLQAFADQAAIAIENAQLHDAARRHAAELEERVAERTAELERARTRMQTILDAAGEGILFTALDWTIEYANPALERITGFTAAEMKGQSPLLWQSGQTPRWIYEDLNATLQRGEVWHGEMLNRRRNGEMYDAALTASPYQGPHGDIIGLVVIHRDVTRQKELERLKNQFVSNVSHELRTPLANVKLYINLLDRGRPEKRGQYMQTLHRETARLQKLIEDLLDLSRLDLGTARVDFVLADLNRMVAELIADRTALAAERSLSLDYESDPYLPLVLTDPAMLGQVMSNLMTNAINYTQHGGAITLSTAVRERQGKRWVTLNVQDNGPGISEADIPHLFERFYRGEAGRASGAPGTGLGLAICMEIVRKLNGDLTVRSRLGQGATFTVWLPLAAQDDRS